MKNILSVFRVSSGFVTTIDVRTNCTVEKIGGSGRRA